MPSETGNRNLAKEYIPGLIEEGYTNTEITAILKEEGLSYRNQNMFADINAARLEYFGAGQIKGLSTVESIPDRLMNMRELSVDYPYSAVVKYKYTDVDSGLEFESGTTLYFSSAPSQSDVLEAFSLRQETLLNLYPSMGDISEAEKVYYYRNVNS
jgi:hypothetical protein